MLFYVKIRTATIYMYKFIFIVTTTWIATEG